MDQPNTDIELQTDEGTGPMRGGRFVVYDDATGKPIVPGTLVKGHPTIGYGIALDVNGISQAQALSLMHESEDDMWSQLVTAMPWAANLDPVRQCALLSMAYNLGIQGVLNFPNTMNCLRTGQWAGAVANLQQSRWWNQVGQRAQRIAQMFLTGQWQLKGQS